MTPIPVTCYTLTSALGTGLAATRQALREGRSGLTADPWPGCDIETWLGRVTIPDTVEVAADWLSRNNRLAALGLAQDGFSERVAHCVENFGAHRVGVAIGTSTSSIDRTEAGYRELGGDGRFAASFRQPRTHNPHSTGAFVAHLLGIEGPAITVSAACASSAKVFASAARWLQQELVDAVVVGGVDSLCLSVLYGFHSLQLVSARPCRPFDRQRNGISLGEAAGFVLLQRATDAAGGAALLGYGESCDAHHMSSAHPEGLGARLSMERAVAAAGIDFVDLDYVNLHGTGTRANDVIEGKVCADLLSANTLASATKGWTGHTLGAAGIVEAVLCLQSMESGWIAGTVNTADPEADFNLLLDSVEERPRRVLSNSFGFGGTNCSLVLGVL